MTRFQFPLFLLFLWGVALFHRREHRLFLRQVTDICAGLRKDPSSLAGGALKNMDWRTTGRGENVLTLKRAFDVRTREDVLRYGMPLALLAAVLLLVQSWTLFFFYSAVLGLKWFCVETVVSTAGPAFYEVRLFGRKLFGESLKIPDVNKT